MGGVVPELPHHRHFRQLTPAWLFPPACPAARRPRWLGAVGALLLLLFPGSLCAEAGEPPGLYRLLTGPMSATAGGIERLASTWLAPASPVQRWQRLRNVSAAEKHRPAAVFNPLAGALDQAPAMPAGLRADISRLLLAIERAEIALRQAWPDPVDADRRRRLAGAVLAEGDAELDLLRRWIGGTDRRALLEGMIGLVRAVASLSQHLSASRDLPAIDWQTATPLGSIILDTTGRSGHRRLETLPLLLVDAGGDDHYEFLGRDDGQAISILIDVGGNDRYDSLATAACPAAAILGFGILWDDVGDDRYEAGDFAQGAALGGAALLYDGGGNDRHVGWQWTQGFAMNGYAMLIDHSGDDHRVAVNRSQASAGPGGVALLVDDAGNDRYELQDRPDVLPSAQLPDHGLSLGQGAAGGLRGALGAPGLPGGLAMLVDAGGDDRYEAQVFAQGAGYYRALGLLVDGGGHDRYAGRWYVQGAAAHEAIGALVKRGRGNDEYVASHTTSLAAAHDRSLAYFRDQAGDDRYCLGSSGPGAATAGSRARFVDGGGQDCREFGQPDCVPRPTAKAAGPCR